MEPKPDKSPGNFGIWTISVSPSAVRFRLSTTIYVFCILVLVIGVLMLSTPFFLKELRGVAIIGAIHIAVGVFMLADARRKKFPEFDLVQDYFYPEGRARSIRELSGEEECRIPFREMQGFRLDSYMEGSGRSRHRVFELELLCSGDRSYPLLRGNDFGAFWCDAVALSRAIGVPLPAPDEEFRKVATKNVRAGQIFLAVCGTLLFAGSLVFAYFGWVQGLRAKLRSDDWVKVPATVLRSEVKRSGSGKNTSYRALIEYQYCYRGQNFSGSACDFWDDVTTGRGSSESLCRKYPAGSTCECWVDPADPVHAVLSREWPGRITFVAIAVSIFHLGGLGMVVTGFRQLCRRLPDFPDAGQGAEKERGL